MQVPEHRRTVAKKRNGTVHTLRQKNIAPAGEPTVRPHAAKPNARRKTGRTPQSRTPTAKPNADGKAGRRRQNESRAPLRTLCLSSGCASPYLTSIWRVAAAVSSIFFLGMPKYSRARYCRAAAGSAGTACRRTRGAGRCLCAWRPPPCSRSSSPARSPARCLR